MQPGRKKVQVSLTRVFSYKERRSSYVTWTATQQERLSFGDTRQSIGRKFVMGMPLNNGAPETLTRTTAREQGIIYKNDKNWKRKNKDYKSKERKLRRARGNIKTRMRKSRIIK